MTAEAKILGLVFDPACLGHEQEDGHPEAPGRVLAVQEALEEAGLAEQALALPARLARSADLELVHERDYVRRVEEACARGPAVLGPDVVVSPGSWDAARLAAGGAMAAVDAVLEGRVRRAFCNLRPPGHHALPGQAMGFCVFNNVALAARQALARRGLERVLIVDWDLHHGNGTEEIFYRDPGVFYFSVHCHPFYPGTGSASRRGAGAGEGSNLNAPLPPGRGDDAMLEALRTGLLPEARRFRPQIILVSCGFDAHRDDPLSGLSATAAGFGAMTRLVVDLARECCQGRLVSVLEGGYDLKALAECAVAHVRELASPD